MIANRLKSWSAFAALLCCCLAGSRADAAQEPGIAQALAIIGESVSSQWDTQLMQANPEGEKRLKPFLDGLNSGVLPEISFDSTGKLSLSEWGMYYAEDDVILLQKALDSDSVPKEVMAAVLVHELRHRFDRRIQNRWIGSADAGSVDSEFRAIETQTLFWAWVRKTHTQLPQQTIAQLDDRLADMQRGFLRNIVEIIYGEPTAKQRLITVRYRIKGLEKLLADLPKEGDADLPEETYLDALKMRLSMFQEEEQLVLEDIKLQNMGL